MAHLGRDVKPKRRHPPALIWWCPDPECDWTHHARRAQDWQWGLDRAWDRHRYLCHSNPEAEFAQLRLRLEP